MIWLGYGQVVDSCECGNEPQVPQNAGNVACFLPGRAKDSSAPLLYLNLKI